MALTWKDVVKMGEDFMCEHCGYGFEPGEWICEIDGCYYHQDCVSEKWGIRVPEPPEPPVFDEDRAYEQWRDKQLEKELNDGKL